ncbi:MAG TPA: HAD family hydrolase [Methylothermaceae bacterium]|nr:HAD family hydrolase [Methylothermaceae bacterium]
MALFDLDNTLLGGDSDYLWGLFLVEQGLVDAETYHAANQRFYDDYRQGRLDIHAFLRFALKPLTQHSLARLEALRRRFVKEKIEPILLPAAQALVECHRRRGDRLAIITATNAFVTEPIARLFGIEALIATEPELKDGRYTGEVKGTPCFREGKVLRLRQWLEQHQLDLSTATFYSDSHNDIPLLTRVAHPVAVDPDAPLERHAREQGWPVMSLRQGSQPVLT